MVTCLLAEQTIIQDMITRLVLLMYLVSELQTFIDVSKAMPSVLYVTIFVERCLVHTQFQSLLFTLIQWINSLKNSQLHCPPLQIVNFMRQSIPQVLLYRWREEVVGSHEVMESSIKKYYTTNGISLGYFELHISQNVAKFVSSLNRQLCGDSLQAVYLSR